MTSSAYLSLDWAAPKGSVPAKTLTSDSTPADMVCFSNCEGLFQRRPDGYEPLKDFRARLGKLIMDRAEKQVSCHFNAFAYAFLSGAKNIDLNLPEDRENSFREEEAEFREQLIELEKFEQLGEQISGLSDLTEKRYLEIRAVLGRTTARDERWVVAELLISGPATLKELQGTLGSNEGLLGAILRKLAELQVTEDFGQDQVAIRREALPYVYFLIREILGIDPLEILAR